MYSPTELLQAPLQLPIPDDIGFEFLVPEGFSSLWRVCKSAVLVSVPKAPVHEDNCLQLAENNIRTTREFSYMDAEAETQSVQQGPDGQFRLRILGTNSRHVPAAPLFIDAISHALSYRHNSSVEKLINNSSYLSCQ
jgi:hypothetical protein